MKQFIDWMNQSVTAYHAVDNFRRALISSGATELSEKEKWTLEKGKTYFVIRSDAALMAFSIPENAVGYRVFACHDDSPCYKIKENPEMVVENAYVKLNVEGYGGMIGNTWPDRPLTVAGRLTVEENGQLKNVLVYVDRDMLLIPNVAIHQADEYKYNTQVDLLPLYGGIDAKGQFMKEIAAAAGVDADSILGHDLYLVSRAKATVWGPSEEFISSPRIDDLECAYAGFQGFLNGKKKNYIPVFALFNGEEVGSRMTSGAASTFLADTVRRISECLCDNENAYQCRIADSFLLSADNGHAVHPNHPEKTDPTNRPVLNGGILIKYAASQTYTTDGATAAFVKNLCRRAEVPYQIFFNRSDMRGGSTLGNISTMQIPFASADIGLAQLAMHASFETGGAKDLSYMEKLATEFFA